jgi:hypothetical protein
MWSTMAKDERTELVDHLNRCRDLLGLLKDPAHRRTISDLIAYLESKLAAMEARNPPGPLSPQIITTDSGS